MITTMMMTSVVRSVSSRVGQTTLRSSNCDSTRYSRIERPAFVKAHADQIAHFAAAD